MNFKRYMYEIIIGMSLILLIGSYVYKHYQQEKQNGKTAGIQKNLDNAKEVIVLKNLWAQKTIFKKVKQLQNLISPSKVKWIQKQKTVEANYKSLSASELNKLVNKILNTPVIITQLNIDKIGSNYNMELKCGW